MQYLGLVHKMNNTTVVRNMSGVSWPYVKEPRAVFIARLTLEVIVAFLGVCGNGLVCFTITRQTSVRSTIRYYIRNLAIADIGILLLNFPIAIVREQMPYNWPLGEEFCLYIYPIIEIFHGASIWSIAAIALERYRYISPSMRYAKHSSLAHQKAIIGAIWVISFLVGSLPLLFIMKYFEISEIGEFCIINWPGLMFQTYNTVLCVFWYLLPLSMITLSYVQISKELRASNSFHRHIERNESRRGSTNTFNRRMELNYRAKKILTPIVVLFAVTMFPINLLRIMAAFWEGFSQNKYFLVFFNVAVIAVIVSSAADPLVYYFATKDSVKEILNTPCKLPKKVRLVFKRDKTRQPAMEGSSRSRYLIVQCGDSESAGPDHRLRELGLKFSLFGVGRKSAQTHTASPV